MLKVYGKRQSRAARCLWVLEELGSPYLHVPVDTQSGENRQPDFLALNAAGKVPVIDDDGFVLRESIAITVYLVSRAVTPLWPADVRAQARIHQWNSWAVTEMEFPLNGMFREKRRVAASGGAADPGFMTANTEVAHRSLQQLEDALATGPHVTGEAFTLADINAYTSVMLAPMFVEMASYPKVRAWMERCAARPAWQRVAVLP